MIGENYLHVQRWRPNFIAEEATISCLPVWVRFLTLPLEYYKESWLCKAGDQIGRTIKVDSTTRDTARGRFARVCVEIDLKKPLMSCYKMKGRFFRLQYEGLHDICFKCEKYGHKEISCPLTMAKPVQELRVQRRRGG